MDYKSMILQTIVTHVLNQVNQLVLIVSIPEKTKHTIKIILKSFYESL